MFDFFLKLESVFFSAQELLTILFLALPPFQSSLALSGFNASNYGNEKAIIIAKQGKSSIALLTRSQGLFFSLNLVPGGCFSRLIKETKDQT